MIHRLHYVQILPVNIDKAWGFFSKPENLDRITPGWLRFEILSIPADEMYPGMLIEYVIKALAGIPMRWLTEITHVQKPEIFVDEQRLGPYRFWHHQHIFHTVPEGVKMTDLVHYSLPFPRLSFPLHALVIRPRLEEIFAFRRQVLSEIFS